MNRNVSRTQVSQSLLVVVHEHDIVPQICEARSRNQTYITGTNYHDMHERSSLRSGRAGLRRSACEIYFNSISAVVRISAVIIPSPRTKTGIGTSQNSVIVVTANELGRFRIQAGAHPWGISPS